MIKEQFIYSSPKFHMSRVKFLPVLLLWKKQTSSVLAVGLKHPGFLLTFIGNETKHVTNVITSIRFKGGMVRLILFYGQIELFVRVAHYYER